MGGRACLLVLSMATANQLANTVAAQASTRLANFIALAATFVITVEATLGLRETNHIIQMITLSKQTGYLSSFKNCRWVFAQLIQKLIDYIISDCIKRLPLCKNCMTKL